MLEVRDIYKSFNGRPVLKGLNLKVDRGEIYGLVGENGAGKTTLMNIIIALLKSDGGEVVVDGVKISSPADIRGKIGYMLDIPSMFEFMSAYEYLEYLASASELTKAQTAARSDELLSLVGLGGAGKMRIKTFSRGMKQRMGIAAGMLADPEIVLMDEPSSALDPKGRYEVTEIIRKLAGRGKTVLLSTHILSDVEKVCGRIGLLIGGRIKLEGSVSEILYKYSKPYYNIVPSESDSLQEVCDYLLGQNCAESVKVFDGRVCALTDGSEQGKKQLFSALGRSGFAFDSVALNKATMEQIFIEETNR